MILNDIAYGINCPIDNLYFNPDNYFISNEFLHFTIAVDNSKNTWPSVGETNKDKIDVRFSNAFYKKSYLFTLVLSSAAEQTVYAAFKRSTFVFLIR